MVINMVVSIGNPNQTRHLNVHHEKYRTSENISFMPYIFQISAMIKTEEFIDRHPITALAPPPTQEEERPFGKRYDYVLRDI